jgi:hypothetical protein
MAALVLAGLQWHRKQLTTRPYVTNAITSGSLMLFGDRLAQRIEADTPGRGLTTRESTTRTVVLTGWSACVSAPFWTWWYVFLERALPGRVLTWVAVTALIPAPATTFTFFTVGSMLEHLALHEAPLTPRAWSEAFAKGRQKVEEHFTITVVRSASLWVPVNCVNFYLVPATYRTTFGAGVGLLWNVYISLVQHSVSPGAASHAPSPPRLS